VGGGVILQPLQYLDYIISSGRNNELEGIWKGTIVA
jgi:hypothetical protein